MVSPPFLLSIHSLKLRSPLLIGTLLIVVIVTSTPAAHRASESGLEAERERWPNLTAPWATLSQQPVVSLTNKTIASANALAFKSLQSFPSLSQSRALLRPATAEFFEGTG